jgi:hypothetical protein
MIRGNICNFLIFFFFLSVDYGSECSIFSEVFSGWGVLGVLPFCSFLGGLVLERSNRENIWWGLELGLHDWVAKHHLALIDVKRRQLVQTHFFVPRQEAEVVFSNRGRETWYEASLP